MDRPARVHVHVHHVHATHVLACVPLCTHACVSCRLGRRRRAHRGLFHLQWRLKLQRRVGVRWLRPGLVHLSEVRK